MACADTVGNAQGFTCGSANELEWDQRLQQQQQEQRRRRVATVKSREWESNFMIELDLFLGSAICRFQPINTKAASAELLIRGLVKTVLTYKQFTHETSAPCKDMHNSWPG